MCFLSVFKYDTVHGVYEGTVENDEDHLIVDGKKIKVHHYIIRFKSTHSALSCITYRVYLDTTLSLSYIAGMHLPLLGSLYRLVTIVTL